LKSLEKGQLLTNIAKPTRGRGRAAGDVLLFVALLPPS
jgi:hypothetical protein